jgi:hypothetical protein
VVRQGHHIKTRVLIAVVGAFLIGCAVFLVVGGSGVQAQASKEGQGRSAGAASEEDPCGKTRSITWLGARYTTNDVPGCPHGGLLSGTDQDDYLAGKGGDDEIRGLGAADELHGGYGTDVIYGGPGGDFLVSGVVNSHDRSKSVLYGGDGADHLFGAEGEDVLYGGDGNDWLDGRDRRGVKDTHRDELYCGEGRDQYIAGRLDYVSSSCEEGKLVDTGGPPLILLAGAALLLSSGLVMSRYVISRAS